MINSAAARTISELFNPDKDITYFIPKYQREYVWGKKEWELLFDDILSNENSHFLGSIICINSKRDSQDNDRLELIDGQQRMTTLNILFITLYEHLSFFKNGITDEEEQSEFNSELLNLKYKLILKSDKKTLRLEPSVSGKNKQDFEHLFSFETKMLENRFNRSASAGIRRIVKAFRYFLNRLQELIIIEENEEKIETLIFNKTKSLELLKKINSALLVKIEVNNHSDAFTLFETLNNRGVPLSPIDLIKNSFLNQSEKLDKNSIDENFDNWNRLIQNLTEDYNVQERFLRHFYNSFKNEEQIEIKGRTRATRSNLIDIYDSLIVRDTNYFFERLYKSSEIYNKLITYNQDGNSEAVASKLKDLQNIGGASSYALLLYSFEKYTLTEPEKINLIEFLVKFFLRRNITDTPPTRDLDTIFIETIKKLHLNTEYSFELIKKEITGFASYPSDSFFMEKLNGKLYEENAGSTRFILCKIEELNNKTKETYTDLWARDSKNNFIWTIEHIFPQGENIPEQWTNMIADGDKRKAKEIQEEWVHTIGNLTLTGYNSQLSNLSFDKKRDRTNPDKAYVGYKNGMFLNKEIKDKNDWKLEDIKNRGEKLISLILEYIN